MFNRSYLDDTALFALELDKTVNVDLSFPDRGWELKRRCFYDGGFKCTFGFDAEEDVAIKKVATRRYLLLKQVINVEQLSWIRSGVFKTILAQEKTSRVAPHGTVDSALAYHPAGPGSILGIFKNFSWCRKDLLTAALLRRWTMKKLNSQSNPSNTGEKQHCKKEEKPLRDKGKTKGYLRLTLWVWTWSYR